MNENIYSCLAIACAI